MEIVALQVLNSLFYAAVLFLIAAGLSLLFGVMGIVNMVIRHRWMGIWGLVFAGLAAEGSAQAQPDREDSVRAVRAVLERQVADWNRGELEAVPESDERGGHGG